MSLGRTLYSEPYTLSCISTQNYKLSHQILTCFMILQHSTNMTDTLYVEFLAKRCKLYTEVK